MTSNVRTPQRCRMLPLLGLCLLPRICLATSPPVVEERAEHIGAGVIIGEPTGLSAIMKTSEPHAFDAALAWSLPDQRLHIHADYLVTLMTYEDWEYPNMRFPISVGVGARLRLGWNDGSNDTSPVFGVRVPFNLALLPRDFPLDVFIELVPVVGLYPATRLDLDAALGVRYYFR